MHLPGGRHRHFSPTSLSFVQCTLANAENKCIESVYAEAQVLYPLSNRDYCIFTCPRLFIADTASAVHQQPAPWRLALYSALLVIHVGIHWFLERMITPRQILLYIILQGSLAFVIVLMSSSTQMIFGLFLPLLGEIAGLLGINRKSFTALGFYSCWQQ
jgi:hypothetical protein